jgi:hypothetical protein
MFIILKMQQYGNQQSQFGHSQPQDQQSFGG